MSEPVHGSTPAIAGKRIANPLAQIWSGAMMLEHLGEGAALEIEKAIETVIAASEPKTPDLGGNATTQDLGSAILAEVAHAKGATDAGALR